MLSRRPAATVCRWVLACLLIGLGEAMPVAAQSTIRPGWGFNWRLRDRAVCRPIDTTVLPICSRCREVPNAYQSGLNAQACYLVPRFEYMIFATESDCQTGLQLMKSGSR